MNVPVARVMDDDKEVEDLLRVHTGVSKIEDESAAMARDGAVSAVVDALKIEDQPLTCPPASAGGMLFYRFFRTALISDPARLPNRDRVPSGIPLHRW